MKPSEILIRIDEVVRLAESGIIHKDEAIARIEGILYPDQNKLNEGVPEEDLLEPLKLDPALGEGKYVRGFGDQ